MLPVSEHNRIEAFALALFLLGGLLLTGCGAQRPAATEAQKAMPAMVVGDRFCLTAPDGTAEEIFLNGVNLGAASAGNYPGEFGIDKETYLRWFGQISDMNVQVIRVYVNQMPDFYQALLEFNSKAERPLWLLHGVYANEDLIAEYGDAFAGEFRQGFLQDIRNAVDMIHG